MTNKVLIVAAHPDDEILGMGGTALRHVNNDDSVYILFLGDGVGSRGTESHAPFRRSCAQNACDVIGAEITVFETFPDNRFDSVPLLDIVKKIEIIRDKLGPHIVYTHHSGDLNIDHRITHEAVVTAFRPLPGELFSEIYSFEVLSSTEWGNTHKPFIPDTYVDVSSYLETIIKAYNCYKDEVKPDPHARSENSLRIKLAGRGREVGVAAAEAFQTIKRVVR